MSSVCADIFCLDIHGEYSDFRSDNMSETPADRSPRSPPKRLAVLLLHCAEFLLAVILLGFNAYSVRYVAYSVLAYSLVVVICTTLVCAYLIACLSVFTRLYIFKVVLGLQIWILVFWIVNLGLIADLSRFWQLSKCTYTFSTGYQCTPLEEKDMKVFHERDTTSFNTYSGSLVAAAVFTAFEV
ncbi:hypothetical protein EJ02DRAFT_417889 [Clathrospora elynae]|uniref:MARVEL domain-containing protein n=1 Tax=Clathrospora elynae TaxID=706981 RepID=A0A6A5T3W8_9PLEO|nr:hypothetical protein EJ02DRAFT_417889 [Clathrospora elynae]